MPNITKNHKIYYRKRDGSIRRLDRASVAIYNFVMVSYFKGDAKNRYEKANSGVVHWQQLKSIDVKIYETLKEDFLKIAPSGKLELSYNSSWRPFIRLIK